MRVLLLLLLASLSTFAAGREIAPRPLVPTPYHTTQPQTAFAGNRFLTTWTESRGEIGHSELVSLGDMTTAVSTPVAAIEAGDGWLVAWTDLRGRLNVAVLRNGALEQVRTLALTTTVPAHRYRTFSHLALARNASHTLLAWTEELRLSCGTLPPCGDDLHRTYAAQLTSDGELATGPLEVPGGMHSLSVATSGEEFLIVAVPPRSSERTHAACSVPRPSSTGLSRAT